MLVKLLLLGILSMLTWQDLKYRAVYWWLFPVLACLEVYLLVESKVEKGWIDVIVNYSLLTFQLGVLTVFYSIKAGHLVNITKNLLCWGDILFLFCIGLALPSLLFLTFNIFSLVIIAIAYFPQKNVSVPLAGLQALIYGLLLIGEWGFGILTEIDKYLLMIVS